MRFADGKIDPTLDKLNLSENEIKLFIRLGYEYILDRITNPIYLYRTVAEQLFIDNIQNEAVEAFRRGCRALHNCEPCRHTPEFDKLLEFDNG